MSDPFRETYLTGLDQNYRLNAVFEAFRNASQAVMAHCPNSEERQVCLTRLEEAYYWSEAAIMRAKPDPEDGVETVVSVR